MKHLFPVLEARFNGDKRLKSIARKLYRGFDGAPLRSVGPYVEVSLTGMEASDTFDSDIDIYSIEFTLFHKGPTPDRIDDMVFEMRRVFKDAGSMGSSRMDVVGFERQDVSGPSLEDAVFRASMSYRVFVQWKTKRPSVRAA